MGCSCSSSSKTEVNYPEPSPQETALMNMATDALLPSYLEKAGYEVTPTTTSLEDDPKYSELIKQRSSLEAEKSRLLEESQRPLKPGQQRGGNLNVQIQSVDNKLNQVNRDLQGVVSDFKPETHYSTRKLDSPEVESVRSKYGEESDQYKKAKEAYDQELISTDKKKQALVNQFMEKADKFLSGDFSITEDQRQLIEQNMAPQREALKSMFSNIKDQISAEEADLTGEAKKQEKDLLGVVADTFDKFDTNIKGTEMKVGDALNLVGSQIMRTGESMETALKNSIGTNRALMKMGIQDFTGQVSRQVMENAALQGREPTDPEYQRDIEATVAREIERGSLNLASMEADGMVRITERTGQELERLGYQRAALRQQTGEQLGESIRSRGGNIAGVKETTGNRIMAIKDRVNQERFNAAQQEGAVNSAMEEQAANMRFQVGAGMVPQQIGVGINAAQYQDAIAQQRVANSYNAVQLPYSMAQGMQATRMQQPTTTTTQQGSILGTVFDIGGGVAGAYTGIAGANALRGI